MATSVEEAIAEAIVEIKLKEWVIDAEHDASFSEDKPCNYVWKRLNIFHQMAQGDYTWGSKGIYINKDDFTYLWHYGGGTLESISTPFKDLLLSKEDAMKAALDVDWVEITECDEILESGTILAIKATTGHLADTYTAKVWKTGDTTVGFKIISKTTVS